MTSVIAITTGDQDGIGPEITYKSLLKIGARPSVLILIFQGREQDPSKAFQHFQQKFRSKSAIVDIPIPSRSKTTMQESVLETIHREIDLVLNRPNRSISFLILRSESAPRNWVHWAATLAVGGIVNAIVTGPMSKNHKLGHTEILMAETGQKNAFMGFIGNQFSVVLGSGHVPLKDSPKRFLADFNLAVHAAIQLQNFLPQKQQSRPICILGINPHAGESGKIGKEDLLLQKKVDQYRRKGFNLIGPVSADAAFASGVTKVASIYLAAYHDQGLIPFKSVHGFNEAVHVTLGIPILRASVDHGTAKDIYGKNLANAGSMISAINFCIRQLKEKKC